MKVYIKPWEEALKSAKEFDERLVDTVDGMEYIIGISCRYGDWGHIVEAKKDISGTFDRYITYYNGTESFSYPACCVYGMAHNNEKGEIVNKEPIMVFKKVK